MNLLAISSLTVLSEKIENEGKTYHKYLEVITIDQAFRVAELLEGYQAQPLVVTGEGGDAVYTETEKVNLPCNVSDKINEIIAGGE